jgi:hypothetical protein
MNGCRIAQFSVIACLLGLPAPGQTVPCAAWTAEENQTDSAFGIAVAAAGDVNGDGFGDVVVGAPFFENGAAREGRAHLYLGTASGLATTFAWSVESDQMNGFLGNSVASAGDVNGDGFDDVIIGVSGFEIGEMDEGAARVYHGSPAGLATTPAWTATGKQPFAYFGQSVASAGDVNGDGFDDVIVGAYQFSDDQPREGRVLVYLGSATGLSSTAAWFVDGDQTDSFFGNSVAAAGDVNGDGYGDVIVGAPYFIRDLVGFVGRAALYLGSATGLATSPAWTVEGDDTRYLGEWVAGAGDVNGDGFADVVVGAPGFQGAAFVYLGSPAGLDASPDWSAESDQFAAHFGGCVASAGDVNGDGYSDVIVGAASFDGVVRDEGRASVYLGSSTGLASEKDWSARSNQAEAYFGVAVSGAGDVNGDGFGDVIVGAHLFDGGESDEGRASVYLGSTVGLSRSLVHRGDSINADEIQPLDVVLGSSWSAPIRIRHPHGAQGPIVLSVRTSIANGANFLSPVGGRLTEFLISGPLLATVPSVRAGFRGDIPPQPVPNQPALLGLGWAAQYTVAGGGFVDLSEAVYGVVISCP